MMMTLADDPFISVFLFPSPFLFLLVLVYSLFHSLQILLSTLIRHLFRFPSNWDLPLSPRRVYLAPVVPPSLNNSPTPHRRQT